ncbi:bacterial regulatory helix-turn-helix, lysR family protein [Collimonas arenae]|uniref:Bacterial regulatory helix-turn-helix, lysR family protein n=1 Tax=Collimonas arenae TaxID=279058 RepID=A0A127PWT6_9BURK|nr:LysR family transcriptional regulator [Collimonas arenae]AMP02310.1 bacterial regulatory helix-turn-helix, lysR family protein [Collimonas arenae]AMP12206.1 bacterial regulatory helix-turn-helix, lysR family protein [Collimonas arenae]
MLNQLSDLDLRLIRVFLSVRDAGGISAAQTALNVSQSTISTQLATLETRLGFRLCERGRAGFRLTPRGEQFAQSSRQLLENIDHFCLDARQIGRKLVGQLHLGLIGHAAMSANARLSQAIARFRARDEAVTLSLAVLAPSQLEEEVVNGRLDAGIGYFWHRLPNLEYVPLYDEHQVAYCAAGHPLFSQAGTLDSAALALYDWVWRSYPLPEADGPGGVFSPARVTALADNMEAVAVLILSGRHLGFLPQHFAAPLVQQGLLAALNPQLLSYDVTLHMVMRRQSGRGEVLQAFLDDLVAAQRDGA